MVTALEAIQVAEEIAIEIVAAIGTGMGMDIVIVTLTIAIACPPTTTRSFIRRTTIPIMMTAKAPMRSATRMASSPERTMAGADKLTSRSAHTFIARRNEGIVPAKEAATLISRLIGTAFSMAIAKATNTGRIIFLAGSSDHNANLNSFERGTENK